MNADSGVMLLADVYQVKLIIPHLNCELRVEEFGAEAYSKLIFLSLVRLTPVHGCSRERELLFLSLVDRE